MVCKMDKLANKIVEAGQNKKFEELEKLIVDLDAKKVRMSVYQFITVCILNVIPFPVNSGSHKKTKPS